MRSNHRLEVHIDEPVSITGSSAIKLEFLAIFTATAEVKTNQSLDSEGFNDSAFSV